MKPDKVKLTPKNRLKIYQFALEKFDEQYGGFCCRLKSSTEHFQKNCDNRSYNNIKRSYLEIYEESFKRGANTKDDYWFKINPQGLKKRKTILRAAIKSVKLKIDGK